MGWPKMGPLALAAIKALIENGQLSGWMRDRRISFSLHDAETPHEWRLRDTAEQSGAAAGAKAARLRRFGSKGEAMPFGGKATSL
jgi:hypothetical protein